MNILHKVRRFESDLTRTVERKAREWSKSGAREPIEIAQAIVDTVGERLEPAPRGRYVFPFNKLHVSIVAASRDERARFAAVLDSVPALRERIAARLHDAGCETNGMQVVISYVARSGTAWSTPEYHVDFARVTHTHTPASAPVAAAAPQEDARDLHITIVNGTAEQATYVFALPRVNLGRCAEVRDSLSRLIRTNHVAFVDVAGNANHSVSRRHAHIEYVAGARHYRIRDDRSAQGTSIVRGGRMVPVPAGSRGIRLESGDEVVLGEARLRVRLAE